MTRKQSPKRRSTRKSAARLRHRRVLEVLVIGFLLMSGATYGLIVHGGEVWQELQARLPLKVRSIDLQSSGNLSSTDLASLVTVREGDPLFGAWIHELAGSLKQNPQVDGLIVRRNVSGRVVIQIEEKRPSALALFRELLWIDDDGNVLGKAAWSDRQLSAWPIITGPWGGRDHENGVRGDLVQGVEVIKTLIKSGIKEEEISEAHYDEKVGWVVYRVGSPMRIILGWDQFETKVRRLHQVLQDLAERSPQVEAIDLDFSDRAIVSMKGNA